MASASEEEICTFVNGRGQKLRRWSLPNVESPRAVCVMIHGVADHVVAYRSIAEVFWEKHNIALYGYDQVGHGMSEGERVDIKDFQHYVDDLIQFVDIIKSEHAGLSIFAIGHSMGGLVLCQTLLRKPDLVDGAVMYAAAINANTEVVTPFKVTMAKMISRIIPSFPVGGIDDKLLTRDEEELERIKKDPLRYHGSMKARWGHNTLNALVEFNSRISEIIVPVLIAHGGDDKICHIDGSIKLNDEISSTDKTFKTYDKCYHRIHSEPDGQGEQFVADMCEWMNSRIKSQ